MIILRFGDHSSCAAINGNGEDSVQEFRFGSLSLTCLFDFKLKLWGKMGECVRLKLREKAVRLPGVALKDEGFDH